MRTSPYTCVFNQRGKYFSEDPLTNFLSGPTGRSESHFHVLVYGSLKSKYPSSFKLWVGGKALSTRKKGTEWLLGKQLRMPVTVARKESMSLTGDSFRAFVPAQRVPRWILFVLLILLLFIVLAPSLAPDC